MALQVNAYILPEMMGTCVDTRCTSCGHGERRLVGDRAVLAKGDPWAIRQTPATPHRDCACFKCLVRRGNQTRTKKNAKRRASREAALVRSMAL